ncbi:MAG: molybdenum cofactor biosynthesis protein MoaE [Pseudomonadota bacterium]
MPISTLTDAPISASDMLTGFQEGLQHSGGIVSFSGVVRGKNAEGDRVISLFLQEHPTLTERGIQAALDEASARWTLEDGLVRHRIGSITPGETIVFVATASAHRRAAFEAADFLMDYLKTKAVFWKKEVTKAGAAWIEPRAADHHDFDRWQEAEGTLHARH